MRKQSPLAYAHAISLLAAILLSGCGGGNDNAAAKNSSLNTIERIPLKVSAESTYLLTAGHPADTIILENGNLIVSTSSQAINASTIAPVPVAGLQLFKYNNGSYSKPCGPNGVIAPVTHVTSVFGLAPYPSAPLSIGAAIENFGAQFSTILDFDTCQQSVITHVPQRTTYNEPTTGTPKLPGSFDIVFSKDGTHAFVANEYGATDADLSLVGTVGILSVTRHPTNGSFNGTTHISRNPYIHIPNANTIPSVSISHDGKRLYVMSEVADPSSNPDLSFNPNADPTESRNPILTGKRCLQSGNYPQWNGLLTVIDVEKATQGLGQAAIIRSMAAGCSPVRAVESTDGNTVWVSARGDNRVLAFDVNKLISASPNTGLLGYADSGGAAPVGLALFQHNQLLAIANSNRFQMNNPDSTGANVSILDVRDPSNPTIVQTLPARYDAFPRNIRVGQDDSTLVVSNFQSRQLQIIRTAITP